jgi:glycosyltransferase involved in cell wall biosynthesis
METIETIILTKNRPAKQKTAAVFDETGIEYKLLVEPQEQRLYKGYDLIVLPENDKGIAYARNFILDYAKDKGIRFICMADDDISRFGRVENGRNVRDNTVVHAFFDLVKKYPGFAQYTINYWQYAYCSTGEISMNCF